MSRKGNCLDNSVMENFFGLLKQEIYYGVVFYSYEELKSEIERFIKYYNEKRIKEKLGWMSPVQYRLQLLAVYRKTRRPKSSRKSLTLRGHLKFCILFFILTLYRKALLITPQAIFSPEFPDGCVIKSSGFA